MSDLERAAIYVRVSTAEQETDLQEHELKEYCGRGWSCVVYRDKGQSGSKNDRPALTAMLNDLRRRRIDVIVVWALDRLARSLVDKKNGKTVTTSKTVVSQDGKTANFEFTDSSNTNADPVTGKGTTTQVAKGPAGSHAVSGSWVTSKMETLSDNGLTVTFKVEGDSLSMTNLTGQSYVAKLDGTDSPYKGDPGTTSVSVKSMGKDTIEETDKRDGKVISVARMTVGSDGKTMTMKFEDKLHGSNMQLTAAKQ